ncbi:MAG: glycosyltransferase family 39 protein [Anaerolineae bacterium]|nr:MAG: glycosyltransferase family 39 protein [Anaerolineae bacterium]
MPDQLAVRQSDASLLSSLARQWARRPQVILLAVLVVLCLASFGLRVYRLGDKSVWWDEGLAAWAARQSPAAIARWTAADVHPPLYFWTLHFWRLGSGDSEFGLRLLSAAVGVLTVAVTYRLGRAVGGVRAGLLAALLVAISRFDIWWSQEMRMYALAALLAALSLWAALCFWDRDRLADAGLYVLFTVAGLYTLYLSVSVMVVANLAWLGVLGRARRRGRAALRWGLAQVAVLALFVPWLLYALGRIPTWSSASPVAFDVFLRIYWTVLTTGIPVSVESYLCFTLPVLAVFLAGLAALLWAARRDWRVGRNAALLLLAVLLPAAAVYLVSLPREAFFYSPQLAPRYLLIFAPAFYVLLAWGLSSLRRQVHWVAGTLLAAVVLVAAGYGQWEYYPGRILLDDYKALAATLHAYQRPGDAVVLYTDKDWPVFAYHHPGRWWGVPHAHPMTAEAAATYLAPIWADHQGVWLAVTPYAVINDPQGEIPAWLAGQAARVVEHRFADKVLRFYARTRERAASADELRSDVRAPRPLQMGWGTGPRLVGYDQPVRVYQSGDMVHLFLYWQGGIDQPGATRFEVSLVDGEGGAWKRVGVSLPELALASGYVRQQVDLIVPPEAPTGEYAFALQPLDGDEAFRFGRVALQQRQRTALTAADVAIVHPLQIDFSDGVRLLGYDLEAEGLRPGGTVYLTLYWQARGLVERRYKVFTHLLGEVFNAESGSFLWGQQDNEPVGGTRPTSGWRPGEVVVDGYAILLDRQAPAGRYALEIGLYDPATGERLPLLDGQGTSVADHLVLDYVAVGAE